MIALAIAPLGLPAPAAGAKSLMPLEARAATAFGRTEATWVMVL